VRVKAAAPQARKPAAADEADDEDDAWGFDIG